MNLILVVALLTQVDVSSFGSMEYTRKPFTCMVGMEGKFHAEVPDLLACGLQGLSLAHC